MALLLNGVNYAWANITIPMFGLPLIGVTKINYKQSQVKDNNYGMGREPVSRGYGNIEYEGEIEMYYDEVVRLNQAAIAAGGKSILDIPWFDLPIVFGGVGVAVNTTILQATEFKENPLQANQGDTKLLVTIPLIIGGIIHR